MTAFLVVLVAVMITSSVAVLRREDRIRRAADRHVSRTALRRLEAAGHIPPAPR